MPFQDNIAFSCLALDGPYLRSAGDVTVEDEATVSGRIPVELDETWEKWLGTIQARKFRDSGLVVIAQRQVPPLENEGHVIRQLDLKVRSVHYCLLLQGCAFSDGGLHVRGNTRNGNLHVGPLGPVDPYPKPPYRRFRQVTAERVAEAATLAPGCLVIYSRADLQHRRVRRGFNSWIYGVGDTYADLRLNWFVRSLEAVMRLPRQGITRSFKNRGQELIGVSGRNEKLLQQLYDLRSCVQHIKNYEPDLRKPRGVSRDQALGFWTLCAELLASETYKRIFASAVLRECLRNETTTSGFWRRKPARRYELMSLL